MLYLSSDHLPVFIPLGIIGFYRYLWYFIRISAWLSYRPIPVPERPTYHAEEDVTILIPTIDQEEGFFHAMQSFLVGKPKEILIITTEGMQEELERFVADVKTAVELTGQEMRTRIRVLTVPKANKRLQMVAGIRACKTDIIVFADDDAIWPPTLLSYVLACFEDPQMGGVGTSQCVKPLGEKMTIWETLAAFRLSIRNTEIAASTHIDGGVPCLSGRTAAYRTLILKDPEFLHAFTHDYWLGRYQLNSGDDKFLTRWMVSHGWKTYVQACHGAELRSSMRPDWRFLKQCLRWTRNTWRSDLRSVFTERHVWRRHPYTTYTMIDKFLNPLTLLVGPGLVIFLCVKSGQTDADGTVYRLPSWNVICSWLVWLQITRAFKLLPHLIKRPRDIFYVPVWVLFGYYFAVMKIYALFTLHETGWGTRAGVEDASEATRLVDIDPEKMKRDDTEVYDELRRQEWRIL